MRKILISIPTIKYIISMEKINVQHEVRRNVVNYRDKKEGHREGVLYI